MAMTRWYSTAVPAIERSVGEQYLKFHSNRYALYAGGFRETTLRQALNRQKQEFYDRFRKLNTSSSAGSGLTDRQIDSILNEFSQNGVYGSEAAAIIEKSIDDAFGQNGFGTGADIMVGNQSLTSLGRGGAATEPEIMQRCSDVNAKMQDYVNGLIIALSNCQEGALAETVRRHADANGTPLSANAMRALNGNGIITGEQVKEAGTKLDANMRTFYENLKELDALAQSIGKGSTSSLADSPQNLFKKYVSSLSGCANAIGGFVHELMTRQAFDQAAQSAQAKVMELHNGIRKQALAGRGVRVAKWEGTETSDPKFGKRQETKNDVSMLSSDNGGLLSMTIGGTVRLRRGGKFNAKSASVGGFVARQETLSSLAGKLPGRQGEALLKYAYGEVGAWENSTFAADSWERMKNLVGALSMLDAISGKGMEIGDLSSIIVVNDKVFTVPDVLSKVLDNVSSLGNGKGRPYTVSGLSFSSMQGKIKAKSAHPTKSGKGWVFAEAYYRNKNTYEMVARQKIGIAMNFGYLYKRIF